MDAMIRPEMDSKFVLAARLIFCSGTGSPTIYTDCSFVSSEGRVNPHNVRKLLNLRI